MKKIFKGFTLAEVLVTLATIGIVAALTLPNLNRLSNASQVGPAVAKAMNTLENASKLWLQDNNARRLSAACFSADILDTDDCLGKYIDGYIISGDDDLLQLKDGSTYWMQAIQDSNATIEIYVDINGVNNNPNTPGRDRFSFRVQRNGNVVAFGSREYKNTVNAQGSSWEAAQNGCANVAAFEAYAGGVGGYVCTGSIVDNNFKVLYFD